MKNCATCNDQRIRQTSSTLTRLLVAVYAFLLYLFFVGGFYYEALFALIPLVIPHFNKCLNCGRTFLRVTPQWNKASLMSADTTSTKYLVGMLPTMTMLTLLIGFFPYTGLGRIVYLPLILLLNSIIVAIGLVLHKYLNGTSKFVSWFLIILITLLFTILYYPQEGGPHVINQIFS